eukprot:864311-Amphidinium_carterae.1
MASRSWSEITFASEECRMQGMNAVVDVIKACTQRAHLPIHMLQDCIDYVPDGTMNSDIYFKSVCNILIVL